MTKSSTNWGILGTAEIARKWVIPALQPTKNANLVAVASSSGKAKAFAKRFGIPKHYDKYDDLLADPEIDIVYIPLPNNLHAQWVIQAAKKGKHILCEKPAALTADQTEEMIRVCEENQVFFMEAMMYQFHPQHQRILSIIDSGEIGEIQMMRASFSFVLRKFEGNFRMSKEMGGGSLYDIGCYCIHAIRNIMRSEPIHVYAVGTHHPDYDVDLSATAILELENGLTAHFDCSMTMSERHTYEVMGTKGKIDVPIAFVPPADGKGRIIVTTDDGIKREEIIEGFSYQNGIEHFSDCVLTQTEPRYTKENCIQNMKVLEACHQSIQTGTPIQLL